MAKTVEFTYKIEVSSLTEIEYFLRDVSYFVAALDLGDDQKEQISLELMEAISPIILKVVDLTLRVRAISESKEDLLKDCTKI